MTKPFTIKLLGVLINILTGLIGALIVLFRQDWFGKGDTYAFLFWTVPLAAAVSASGKTFINFYRATPLLLRLVLILASAALLSLGWAYCVRLILGPWINAFSIPILYLWIGGSALQLLFLNWRLPKPAEKNEISKTILGILSFPLTLVVTVIAMYFLLFAVSYFTKPKKETYLIPNDFEGHFRVVYGEKCGSVPSYENGRRILQIPENGVLIIQPKFTAGTVDHEYYLVDKAGNRQKIKMLLDYKQRTTDAPGVLLIGTGSFGGLMPDGSSSSESELAIHYSDFILFNRDTTLRGDREESRFQNRFDSLTSALVNQCRQKKFIRAWQCKKDLKYCIKSLCHLSIITFFEKTFLLAPFSGHIFCVTISDQAKTVFYLQRLV